MFDEETLKPARRVHTDILHVLYANNQIKRVWAVWVIIFRPLRKNGELEHKQGRAGRDECQD